MIYFTIALALLLMAISAVWLRLTTRMKVHECLSSALMGGLMLTMLIILICQDWAEMCQCVINVN